MMLKMVQRFISGYHHFSTVLKPRISIEEYRELRAYANERHIALADFKDFTGNINDIKDIIDKIVFVAADFPKITEGKKHVVLGLHYEDSDTFAGSEANKITLNGVLYNDTDYLDASYKAQEKEGYFVKGTTWKDIIFHELGHIVSNMYHIDAMDIAMNLLHTNLKAEVAEYVSENLSLYSTQQYASIETGRMEYDGSEIIAECFCAYYSNNANEFVIQFMNECFTLAKEGKI